MGIWLLRTMAFGLLGLGVTCMVGCELKCEADGDRGASSVSDAIDEVGDEAEDIVDKARRD